MMMLQQVESVVVATSLLLLVVSAVVFFGYRLAERRLVIEQAAVGLGTVKKREDGTERKGLMVVVTEVAAVVVGVEEKSPVLQSWVVELVVEGVGSRQDKRCYLQEPWQEHRYLYDGGQSTGQKRTVVIAAQEQCQQRRHVQLLVADGHWLRPGLFSLHAVAWCLWASLLVSVQASVKIG
jgi:hypothetical protein